MATILTNKFNLPEVFVQACKVDRHFTNGDISVTQLIDAPQIRQLKKSHDIEEDVSDRIDMLMGTAVHHVLERSEVKHYSARQLMDAAQVFKDNGNPKAYDATVKFAKEKFPEAFDSNNLIEANLQITVDGMVISGTLDKYYGLYKKLEDYKNCSVYNYIYEEAKKKWDAQINVYAAMLRENGHPVDQASIIAIFKDWSRAGTLKSKDYPKSKVMEIPITLLPHDKVMKYIAGRVALHKKADEGGNVLCTAKDRWATADSYAVMNKGGKKALRKMDTRENAQQWIDDNALKYPNTFIQERPGEQKRCDQYCPVRSVCPQIKEINSRIESI